MADTANGLATSGTTSVGMAYESSWKARQRQIESDRAAIDQTIVIRAMKKRSASQALTRDERATLDRYERLNQEVEFWRYSPHIPKIVYETLSGRTTKVLHEQAKRYGLPLIGSTIDLRLLIVSFHNFFASNRFKLIDEASDEGMMSGDNSPALERYRARKADLAEIDLAERRRSVVRTDAVREGLGHVAQTLRKLGERLGRRFGDDAAVMLDEAIEDIARHCARLFEEAPAPEANGEKGDSDNAT